MEYKKTINLPSTDFPMRGNLPKREPEWLEAWNDDEIVRRMEERRADAPLYLLHDGPPYANGHIHIGHALNKILKDTVLKYRNLAGYRTPYRPGWDCHGLPIELEVEKSLGRDAKVSMDPVEVRRRCDEYAQSFVEIQSQEFQRLGVFGDWERPYLTKSADYEAQEVRELATLLETGGLYRSRKPVYWCSSCRTALAEAEVEYDDHKSTSVYVAFEVPEPPAVLAAAGSRPVAIVIWTTTPWTLPANLAISLHPDFEYALVEAGERAVVVAAEMIEAVRETLGLGATLATFRGAELDRVEARHPWIDRNSLVILGEHVTLEAGTGCVHTAPGHGQEDYVVGSRYGLEVYAPVDAAGCFTAEVPEYQGRRVGDCDDDIVAMLDERGALMATSKFKHSYPHCWRCKRPVLFRATEQWFLSMEHDGLRERALAAIDEVRWVPSWGRERIHGMIGNRPDWCLSRQRSWGVPIVAARCKSCDEVTTSPAMVRRAADLIAAEGSDAWWARPIEDFLDEGMACAKCSATDFERSDDILDVWFDSGVSFASVVEADFGTEDVAELYLEGSDQHRGWFHTSLLSSVANRRRAPYKTVLTHGFVLDGDGRKMSKSMGNVIAPDSIIKQYGADLLRLWVAAEDYRDDVRISGEILKRLADSYRRFRNTARNLLGNVGDFDPARHTVPFDELEDLDKWILGRLGGFIERCRAAYDAYEFHVVYHALNNFCSVDLSALYFDIAKDRLYCSATDDRSRRSAQTAMRAVLLALPRVMAPVLSFTADEIWKAIPNRGDLAESVFLTDFPEPDPAWADAELAARFERVWELRAVGTRALEAARSDGAIGNSLEARLELAASGEDHKLLASIGEERLAELLIVSEFALSAGDETTATVSTPEGEKCERCWKRAATVGASSDHPTLCARCTTAVEPVA